MKHKRWPVHIWFLDDDLLLSSQYLTDKALAQSINGCVGALLSTYFYFIGIRSKKFYDYYFGKEHIEESMLSMFPRWPLKKKPSFAAYGWKESKWCRACNENYSYCIEYLNVLLDEYAWRMCTVHESAAFINWLFVDALKFEFPCARIDKVALPWKSIDPKFRKANVIEGYQAQFMSMFEDNNPLKAYGSCRRPIPQFVLSHFNASTAFES